MPEFRRDGGCSCAFHRRRFFQFAAGAGLAAALPAVALAQPLETAEVATLLLICNDPGVWPPASNYIKSRQDAVGRYEPVEIDGAAIGLVAEQYKASRQAFWDKLVAATAFQDTRRVIALNHRGCAAMRIAYGLTKASDRLIETETHRYALQEFRKQMAERNASIDVWIGLIGLDGKVEMFN